MAGVLKQQGRRLGSALRGLRSDWRAESKFARALAGRRYDDPGDCGDQNALQRVNAVDPSDSPND